jgi:tRNA nucleotidyltransferase (CCA-adding enzyme)
MKLPKIIQTISNELQKQNAKAIVVGGSVRDHFLELPIKDYDIEVYGLERMEQLEEVLGEYGSVNLVGKSFGVLKFTYEGEEYDFSFPRSESKVGEGHRGFDVEVDGSMSFKKAARRRDFTVNALGYDVEEKRFIDPFNGLNDIKQKKLRHIDDDTFVEDPLRVYRAVQFCARFGYVLADETFSLCKHMVDAGMLEELPKERIYNEFTKLLLKAEKPSFGFELMLELGILRYFPELEALIGVKQSPRYHPEGDVWVHTMMCLDEMVALLGDDEKLNLKYMFAILCHDLGKAKTTTVEEDGHIRAIGHEEAGLELTKSMMYRLSNEHDFIESLLPLVEHHLKPSQFYADKSKDKAVRRLATKVNIEELVVVAKADFLGRTTEEALTRDYKAGAWLLNKASKLKVKTKPLEHLVQGRDLIDLGLEPSPKFKMILDEVYELQLDGMISDRLEALAYIKKYGIL